MCGIKCLLSSHSSAYTHGFSFKTAEEGKGDSKCQKWSQAARFNLLKGALSYIPIVNLIFFSVIISRSQKKSDGEFLRSGGGKALLGRTILLSVGLIPIVMFLDAIGTFMKKGIVWHIHDLQRNPAKARTLAKRYRIED